MMLGLFASALAPTASSAPLLVIMLMLPQIVLGGALIPIPGFVSGLTSTRWAFEALMGVTGPASDVAADACWSLPKDVREAMTPEDKQAQGCRCMGANVLNKDSCNYPGLGLFYNTNGGPLPVAPAPLGDPPPEPVIPEKPVEPANQSDNLAMADYFAALKVWEAKATAIQNDYKKQVAEYQARSEVYKSEFTAYQPVLVAEAKAEASIDLFYDGFGWSAVNKEDPLAYWFQMISTWVVQSIIIVILFVAILYLQKRKDVT